MELQGERLIPASVDKTWAALNDPAVLKACIAGCESVERTGDDAFTAVVALKVGPVSARFKGNLQMTNIQAPNGYTINFDGQGGVAGFGKGAAQVQLLPQDGGASTRLDWSAEAHVGGRLAQIGSRLIEATVRKMSEDFFLRFAAQLAKLAQHEAVATMPTAEAPAVRARPPVEAWARAAAVALAGGMVYWLCFKG